MSLIKTETIRDLLDATADTAPENIAVLYREREDSETVRLTYQALRERVTTFAYYLLERGVTPGDHVALYAENRPEWIIAWLGIHYAGAVAVPLDSELKDRSVAHLLAHSDSRLLVTDREETDRLGTGDLRGVIDIREPFAAAARELPPIHADDTASILYTSGTMGAPKGVVLTNRNLVSNMTAMHDAIPFDASDNFFLILPLHHTFPFTAILLCAISQGATITIGGHPAKQRRKFLADARDFRPTIFLGVPQLFTAMAQKSEAAIGKNVVTKLAAWVFRGRVRQKIVETLGGRVRIFVSGGAPLSSQAYHFFRTYGLSLVEGYGITEASPVVTVSRAGRTRYRSVGTPVQGVEVRIDAPDAEGVGEILVRGPNVMQGYYKNTELTAETLTDGWLRTGDVGLFDRDGYLFLKSRKKIVIVTPGGKNVYPEELEEAIGESPLVEEVLVYGEDRVCARVFYNIETFRERYGEEELTEAFIRKIISKEIQERLREFPAYMAVREVAIVHEELPKTTILKLKR